MNIIQRSIKTLAIIGVLGSLHEAVASPPHISYQGTLNDISGQPLDGSQDMSFSIWDASQAGNQVWGPFNLEGVPTPGGVFNVILGPTDSHDPARQLDAVFFGSDQRYLQVTVSGNLITPRQRFLSTPFALRSSSVVNSKYAITPGEFIIKKDNFIEFGEGLKKGLNNGTISYARFKNAQFTNTLEIVGGGATIEERKVSIFGDLDLTNYETQADLSVDGKATIENGIHVNNIKKVDSDEGVTVDQLIALTELNRDNVAPRPIPLISKDDQATWTATEQVIDLAPYLDDEDGCRIRVYLQHENSGDLVRNYELLLFTERPGFVNAVASGASGHTSWHGGQMHWAIGDEVQDKLFEAPDNWAFITDYKDAEINNGVHGPEEEGYNVWFFTHPRVSARFIIYDH